MDLKEIVAEIRHEADSQRDAYDTDYWRYPVEVAEAHANFLSSMAFLTNGDILEIGTDTGLSAIALAHGARMRSRGAKKPVSEVVTLEVNEPRRAKAVERFHRYGLENVTSLLGDSTCLLKDDRSFGLIYIDGDHRYTSCKSDLNFAANKLKPTGNIILHDFVDPRSWLGKIHLNGVTHAIAEFLAENQNWYGMTPGPVYFLLSRSRIHPISGWDLKLALQEIDNFDK